VGKLAPMRLPPSYAALLGALMCLAGCLELPDLDLDVCKDGGCARPLRQDAGSEIDEADAAEDAADAEIDTEAEVEKEPCHDGEQNNAETDIDCGGGECEACDFHKVCGANGDCASQQCEENVCVQAPTAGFSLSSATGNVPLTVGATNRASEGSEAIEDVSYDWDDGQGFEPSPRHTYRTGGSYVVRQRVKDARGVRVFAEQTLDVNDAFRQVRFSSTDHSESVRLSPDRLSVEQRGLDPGGVRSDGSIAPMSRVYYFEVERLIARTGNWGFGVATANETLSSEIGHQPESMGVLTLGGVYNNTPDGQTLANCTRPAGFPPETRIFGFVVDYRGANPRVHVVIDQDGAVVVVNSCTMNVSRPLHIFYSGTRYEIGFQARINTGADTKNHPFHFSLVQLTSALATAMQSIGAADLVYGFGGTRALMPNAPPTLNAPADQSVAFGQPVTLVASANDAEDLVVTDKISWLDLASQHHAPIEGVGGTFVFKPNAIGRHPIRVSIRDSVGLVTSKLVQLNVTGELPQANPVALAADAFGGKGVELSNGNLAARFTGGGKYGIRANQGIYRGSFQYFEAHRHKSAGNMGVGVIIGDGSLNPYHFDDVPWSCSVNLTGNTWRNLIGVSNWEGNASDSYGFAVDYRGEHPIVHVLVGSGSTAKLESSLPLDDVWVPLYPMVYGNPQDGEGPDISVNFGAEAFRFDPRPLVPGGATALQLGWACTGADSEARSEPRFSRVDALLRD
jgi:PKD repeat protein